MKIIRQCTIVYMEFCEAWMQRILVLRSAVQYNVFLKPRKTYESQNIIPIK